MSLFDDARRWVKDRFSAPDEYIQGKPEEKMRTLMDVLPNMTQAERVRNLEHVRAYATYYYQGRHNEAVPFETTLELSQMQRRVERLNAVDSARAVLERYGGPPSLETISDALERSVKEREAAQREARREARREAPAERQKEAPRLKASL